MIQLVKSTFAIGMVAAALASASASASPDVAIASISNYTTSTPGCTFISSTGWGNTIVYKLACTNDTVMIAYTNPNTSNCTVNSSDSKYYTSGSCTSLTVYKKGIPEIITVKMTDVTNNNSATNGCTVMLNNGYSGNGFTTLVYKVTCGSESMYPSETTNSTGNCTLSGPGSPYSVTGSCTSYSIFKTTQQ